MVIAEIAPASVVITEDVPAPFGVSGTVEDDAPVMEFHPVPEAAVEACPVPEATMEAHPVPEATMEARSVPGALRDNA